MSRLEFGYCKPCENEVAVVDGECAVCGQPVEEEFPGFHWHYRTIKHYYKDPNDADAYHTVHEFAYDIGATTYSGWSFRPETPLSKQECAWMLDAYELPPVFEVDDAKMKFDAIGDPHWDEYETLDLTVRTKGDNK
jgi:hypothetical protein